MRPNFYQTHRWKTQRERRLRYDGYRCQACGFQSAAGRGELTVHHRVPLSRGGSAFAIQNLKTLCRQCHGEEHAKIVARARRNPQADKWARKIETF